MNNIYRMDALEGMKQIPDNSIDCVVTSPPYNLSNDIAPANGNPKRVNDMQYDEYSDSMEEEDYQKWQIDILNEIHRILKPTGSLFYNHKLRYRKTGCIHPLSWISKTNLVFRQEIIWDRCIAVQIRGWRYWQTDERVYWLTKSENLKELPKECARLMSVWRIMPASSDKHPCTYPEKLVYNCLMSQPKGAVILDPFMGFGTTAVVAKKMGMNYIGFEISQNYIDSANERLNATSCEVTDMNKFFS